MRKGEKTKQQIIRQAAEVFNQRGYYGTSLSDIMTITGLKKGGIYNHFKNKDELALAAFDYAFDVMKKIYIKAISSKKTATEQLVAVISVYDNMIEDPPLKGGCPILNTAIESDDTHPDLRKRAQEAMSQWLWLIKNIILRGIKRHEIKMNTDSESVAIYIASTFEGAVMISKLYQDVSYMKHVIKHLSTYIESLRTK